MKSLSSAGLAMLLLLAAPCTTARAEDKVEEIQRQCGQEYADPFALAKCLSAEEKDYGRRLAAAYKKVAELQTPEAKKILVEAQRSWLAYQEKNCAFHKSTLSFEGGENGDAAAAQCMLRTTMQRLAELEALLPNLEN